MLSYNPIFYPVYKKGKLIFTHLGGSFQAVRMIVWVYYAFIYYLVCGHCKNGSDINIKLTLRANKDELYPFVVSLIVRLKSGLIRQFKLTHKEHIQNTCA